MHMEDLSLLMDLPSMLTDWVPQVASIAVASEGKYIFYHAGGYDLRLRPGDLVRPGSVANRVFCAKKRVEVDVDESVYGLPYHGVGYLLHAQSGTQMALTIILPPRYKVKRISYPFLIGRREDTWYPIHFQDIVWLESYEKQTWIHTVEASYTTHLPLHILEHELAQHQFLRIHRSYIVNVAWIKRIERDFHSGLLIILQLPTEQKLPVSQTYVRFVREKLGF